MITEYEAMSSNTVKVTAECDIDGSVSDMVFAMSREDFVSAVARWQSGALIQNAFPNLNKDEREFLITGITPDKWVEIFGSPE